MTLTVPLDHFTPSDPRTTKVVFAVRPADGKSKGLYVTATGGPGSSGIASADDYLTSYPDVVRRQYDFVFFDQRGIGRSGGLTCPNAVADSVKRTVAIEPNSVSFVAACIDELKSTRLLPYVGTDQSVEDLEALRVTLGSPNIWLIGESYGTQYGQVYAAAHPKTLKGLIIDGVVDLTLSGPNFWRSAARSFESNINTTLRICDKRPRCLKDARASAETVYDNLKARLVDRPINVRFPLATGQRSTRQLTLDLFQAAVSGEMYGTYARMMFLRALVAAGHGDLVPLLRLAYSNAALDPQTLLPSVDPNWSQAMYYGVDCRDYGYYTGTPVERSAAFLAEAEQVSALYPRTGGTVFLSDYPCVWWPGTEPTQIRPAPLVNPGIPTLVLTATADPITPRSQARAVYSRLADGYLITTNGGPHVTFGRGNECPDRLVFNFLIEGKAPKTRETICPGAIVDPYVPLAPIKAASFASLKIALESFQTQIEMIPEYRYWSGVVSVGIGCPVGGSAQVTPTDAGEKFTFDRCSFTSGVAVTGTGTKNADSGRVVLIITVRGRWNDQVRYVNSDS